MKEKISMRFKSLRTNRDRFADDYMMWVEYEREGIMKLNTVVREMFFKHIPFKKDVRDNLENMPAFNKFTNRFKNIRNREFAAYERKFKKYQDETGAYPKEITRKKYSGGLHFRNHKALPEYQDRSVVLLKEMEVSLSYNLLLSI